MKILAIETSCDDTGVAILKYYKNSPPELLANLVSSQIKIHAPFGGVVPMLAKREHQKNLVPILQQALKEANLLLPEQAPQLRGASKAPNLSTLRQPADRSENKLKEILDREPELLKRLCVFFKKYQKPDIDAIAVTVGPGLEPALWVGVNCARALAFFWNLPIIPINHIEAHISANWLTPIGGSYQPLTTDYQLFFPAVCLVVSGGHTQLILIKKFGQYEILGETRDDAAGEAFDKLAKMLNLGYPGGPIVAQLADKFKSLPTSLYKGRSTPSFLKEGWGGFNNPVKLPRPMINSGDYDFSFSGLKTAALYFVKTLDKKTLKKLIPAIAAEFQQAVVDVLVTKTIRAAKEFKAKTVLLSGGVAANDLLRKTLKLETEKLKTDFLVPLKNFCTDNAAMIALAAYQKNQKKSSWQNLKADSNLRIN